MRYKRLLAAALVALLAVVCAAAFFSKNQPRARSKPDRLPSLTVRDDAAGARILTPLKGGEAGARQAVRTTKGDWHNENPPVVLHVVCYTYHNHAGNFCGVACTDNTWYPMSCAADIFEYGFDITE